MTAPLTGPPGRQTQVMITGAGGPAAIAMMRSLRGDPSVRLIAADMDPLAAGLYLVPPGDRALVPAGATAEFGKRVLRRCLDMKIDILIPTVDAELLPLAEHRTDFEAKGIALMLASEEALRRSLDKLAVTRACAAAVRVPRTEALGGHTAADWRFPVVVKPRNGSGSRDIAVVPDAGTLAALPPSGDHVIQEFLPGEEYSIDVFAHPATGEVTAVPRLRARVDSGISVAGRTVSDPELVRFGADVALALGLTYIANVQCRRDASGQPTLLEVNPRPPGSLALTIASGVDMPRMAMDAMLGRERKSPLGYREVAMVRFLDERVVELAEIEQVCL